VQLAFGHLRIGQVDPAEPVAGPGFAVASLRDLAGLKMAVVTQRAEAKDYLDIHALLGAGVPLPDMLAAAAAIYEGAFSPVVSLKALAFHDEPGLADLPSGVRRDLVRAVRQVNPGRLPALVPVRRRRKRP
jgi:hypothetical protein